MHLLVFNGSSFGRRGITSILLNQFTAGAREAGAIVTEISVNKLNVNPCRGDLSCWFKKRGVCIQHDDMQTVIHEVQAADCIVFSTPVFCDGIPGKFKCVIDRMVPLSNPFLELRDSHTRHPLYDTKIKKFVLIASCGLWELENFDPMVMHLKAFCRNIGYDYTAALLRPHSYMLKTGNISDILAAANNAGKEFSKTQSIPDSLLHCISRELISREEYISLINQKAQALGVEI